MKKEIKERIEAVRRGEVPEGYRRTRAGLMPLEWRGNLAAKDVFRNYTNKKHNGEFQVLSATQDRGIIPRSEVDIDIKYAEENIGSYKKVDSGDFVISLRSFQGGIEYSEYEGLVSPAYTVLKATKPIADNFYRAYFKTLDFISRLNGAVYGIRDGKQIGFDDFGDLAIHYPPVEEQQQIAEIMATCDRVIELKQQLLEEKRRQKKWLMQKLLDPNSGVKLSGFESGKWRKIVIGEECEIFSGGTPKAGKDEYYTGGTIPFIRSGEIAENKTELFLTRDGYNSSSAKMVEVGDLLYALYGANSGECAISQINGAINQAILCVRPKHIERKVLYYLLCAKKERIIATYLQGGQGNLSAEIIKKLIVELPVDKEHQSRIVEILRMADQEIICCESELAEWQQKKKALMQLLLTGLVRVNA
jgi:type I restriction enzyme S subunit